MIYAVKHTPTGNFVWNHHEYGVALQMNNFLAFTDRAEAVELLEEIQSYGEFTIKGIICRPEDFVVQ